MTGRGVWGGAAKAVGVFLTFFVLVGLLNADLETDFPELLVLFLVVSLLVDVLWAGCTGALRRLRDRRAGIEPEPVPGRPDVVRRTLLIVVVGLPILVVTLLVAARFLTTSWSAAGERVAGSPYVWLIVVVYLNYALTWKPTEAPDHRRWPGLRAAENLVGGLLGVCVVVSDVLPDRWYGVVLALLVALVAATGLANLTQQLVGPPASRPHAERAS